jgi:hypothetical protein
MSSLHQTEKDRLWTLVDQLRTAWCTLESVVGRIPADEACRALFDTALSLMQGIYSKICPEYRSTRVVYEYDAHTYTTASTTLSATIEAFTSAGRLHASHDDVLKHAATCQTKLVLQAPGKPSRLTNASILSVD